MIPPFTSYLAEEFLARCQEVYSLTQLQKGFFNENTVGGFMTTEPFLAVFQRINNATQEYSLLQLTKLHDPAKTYNKAKNSVSYNLTVNYIVEYGELSKETAEKLNLLKTQLDNLYNKIKPARNKALCHHDIESINAKKTLGAFEQDADEPYFRALEEFANLLSVEKLNRPFKFDGSLKHGVEKFIQHFNRTDTVPTKTASD